MSSSSPDEGEGAKLSLDASLRPRATVRAREVESGLFLLNTATGVCCELNAMGARVFSLLSAKKTLRQAFELLLAEFDVEAEVLERDLLQLAAELVRAEMLERGSTTLRAP